MTVELGLASLATLDLAIKCVCLTKNLTPDYRVIINDDSRYGKLLKELYSSFKDADDEVRERIILIQEAWNRTRQQIDVYQKIQGSLDEDHREVLENVFQMLSSKLYSSIQQIQRVLKDASHPGRETHVKILKYALVKDTIDEAIRTLEAWQRRFDPSWFLILRMTKSIVDQALSPDTASSQLVNNPILTARSVRATQTHETSSRRSIFMSSDGLKEAKITEIPYSSAKLMFRPSKSHTYYVIDSVEIRDHCSKNVLQRDVRDLARKLSVADPSTFGLLKCHGVVKPDLGPGSVVSRCDPFQFVFSVPSHLMQPKSLRHLLLEADHTLSLSTRFAVAQQVAQSASYVHTYGFVHKGIRPEKIVVFQDQQATLHSFLVGFDNFRQAEGLSGRLGDSRWDNNLYRHPQRQGIHPEVLYAMQHDIYSIGVCLLEIGMWQSLATFQRGDEHCPHPAEMLPVYRKLGSTEAGLEGVSYGAIEPGGPLLVQQTLVQLAKAHLPSRMGDKYTEVVVNCLTCLDDDNKDFGNKNEFQDEDGIAIGVRYIEKVRVRTSERC